MAMDAGNNKKVVQEFYQVVFQKHDLSAVSRYMHEDYIQHNPDADQGMKGFIAFHKGYFAAIPDSRATINRMVAEDDIVFVYNTITGTHTGEGFVADTRALFTQVGGLREIKS
jgi:predicted SnoaL-like aldol condensation-catalyzing enzyme